MTSKKSIQRFRRGQSLISFKNFEDYKKIKNFNFYNYLENWDNFFNEEFFKKYPNIKTTHLFETNLTNHLFSEKIINEYDLLVINEDNINIFTRNINSEQESNEYFLFFLSGKKEKTNLNPEILKLEGITSSHMKEYKKNGCFELNGIFYTNEMCIKKSVITFNVAILDIPDDSNLESLLNDKFINYLIQNPNEYEGINTFIHMSHPIIINSSYYHEFLNRLNKSDSKINHVFLHPQIKQYAVAKIEINELYSPDSHSNCFNHQSNCLIKQEITMTKNEIVKILERDTHLCRHEIVLQELQFLFPNFFKSERYQIYLNNQKSEKLFFQKNMIKEFFESISLMKNSVVVVIDTSYY